MQATSTARLRQLLRGPWRVSARAFQIHRVPHKKVFHTRTEGTCVYLTPFNLHPTSEYSRRALKNPINQPVLKTKWTLEKTVIFTYLEVFQLTTYMTKISA